MENVSRPRWPDVRREVRLCVPELREDEDLRIGVGPTDLLELLGSLRVKSDRLEKADDRSQLCDFLGSALAESRGEHIVERFGDGRFIKLVRVGWRDGRCGSLLFEALDPTKK